MVGTAGSGPTDLIDAKDEGSMKILCPSGGVPQFLKPSSDKAPLALCSKSLLECSVHTS